jgi:PD-(D/E)XK endonuclease
VRLRGRLTSRAHPRHRIATKLSQKSTTRHIAPRIVEPVRDLSPTRKGAAAEAAIAAAAIRLGLVVLRPLCEGSRYDLVIDVGGRLVRVQCKWASTHGSVLGVRCITSRHTPRGYLRSTYSADEIDAVAAYAPDTCACYLIPIAEIDGHTTVSLRLGPTANNQALNVRWAQDYDLETSLRRHWGLADIDRWPHTT